MKRSLQKGMLALSIALAASLPGIDAAAETATPERHHGTGAIPSERVQDDARDPNRHHGMGLIPSSEGDWDYVLIFTGGNLEEDRQSAEQGDVDSQFNLGLSYEGRGYSAVKPDNAQAVFWYKKAIEKRKGMPPDDTQRAAQRNLKRLYEKMAREK